MTYELLKTSETTASALHFSAGSDVLTTRAVEKRSEQLGTEDKDYVVQLIWRGGDCQHSQLRNKWINQRRHRARLQGAYFLVFVRLQNRLGGVVNQTSLAFMWRTMWI